MTKAEQRAVEAHPYFTAENHGDVVKARRAFKKGYEAAERDLGWISVKERLPEEKFDDGYTFVYVAIEVDKDTWQFSTDYIRNGKWELHPDTNIVYWMPIPELPTK